MIQIRPGYQIYKASEGDRRSRRNRIKHIRDPGEPPFRRFPVQPEHRRRKAREAQIHGQIIGEQPSRQRKAGKVKKQLRHDPEVHIIISFIIGVIRPVGDLICQKHRGIIGIFQLHQLRLPSSPHVSVQNGFCELPVLLMMLPGRFHTGPVGKRQHKPRPEEQTQAGGRNQLLPAAFRIKPDPPDPAFFSQKDPEDAGPEQQKHPGKHQVKGPSHIRPDPVQGKSPRPEGSRAPGRFSVLLQDQTASLRGSQPDLQPFHLSVRMQVRIKAGRISARRLHYGKRIEILISLIHQADGNLRHRIPGHLKIKIQIVDPHVQPIDHRRQAALIFSPRFSPAQGSHLRQIRLFIKKAPDRRIISDKDLKQQDACRQEHKPSQRPPLPFSILRFLLILFHLPSLIRHIRNPDTLFFASHHRILPLYLSTNAAFRPFQSFRAGPGASSLCVFVRSAHQMRRPG